MKIGFNNFLRRYIYAFLIWLSFWLRLGDEANSRIISCLWLFPSLSITGVLVYFFTGQYKKEQKKDDSFIILSTPTFIKYYDNDLEELIAIDKLGNWKMTNITKENYSKHLKLRISEKTFPSFSIQIHNLHPYQRASQHTSKPHPHNRLVGNLNQIYSLVQI